MKRVLLASIVILLVFAMCSKDRLPDPIDLRLKDAISKTAKNGEYQYFAFPEDGDFQAIPNQEVQNPVTAEKIALGKMLFFETGLGQSAAKQENVEGYSCATCHLPHSGFTPGRIQGIADGGIGFGASRTQWLIYEPEEMDVQGIRPLSVFNVTYVTNSTWSGSFGANGVNIGTEEVWSRDSLTEINFSGMEGLECQNIEGLKLHRMTIDDKVLDQFGYRAFFDKAFTEIPEEERYSLRTASFAISAYLRSLLTNKAPFQKWIKGDEYAMTEKQKRGALLFFTKAKCYKCHKEPNLGSMEFHTLGTRDLHETGAFVTDPNDKKNYGRGAFTGEEADNFKFRVPQLYNVKDYAFYFHGSSKTTLREVIDYKINAVSENPLVENDQLSPVFNPIDLTDDEIEDLIEFLENGLYDSNVQRFVPKNILSGNCFPNNDPVSRNMLGCE